MCTSSTAKKNDRTIEQTLIMRAIVCKSKPQETVSETTNYKG